MNQLVDKAGRVGQNLNAVSDMRMNARREEKVKIGNKEGIK